MIIAINLYLLHLSMLFCISSLLSLKIAPRILLIALIGCVNSLLIFKNNIVKFCFIIIKLMMEAILICNERISVRKVVLSVFIILISFVTEMVFIDGNNSVIIYCSILLLLTGLIYPLIRWMLKYLVRKKEMIIITKKGEKKLQVFLDSGNMLREPVNGLPVIVVILKEICDIVPLNLLFALGLSKENDASIVYAIPYKTIMDEGVLYGFRPKGCIINGREIQCVIAVCNNKGEFGGDCAALCNPDILEV